MWGQFPRWASWLGLIRLKARCRVLVDRRCGPEGRAKKVPTPFADFIDRNSRSVVRSRLIASPRRGAGPVWRGVFWPSVWSRTLGILPPLMWADDEVKAAGQDARGALRKQWSCCFGPVAHLYEPLLLKPAPDGACVWCLWSSLKG